MVTVGFEFSRRYQALTLPHSIILIASSSGSRSGLNIFWILSRTPRIFTPSYRSWRSEFLGATYSITIRFGCSTCVVAVCDWAKAKFEKINATAAIAPTQFFAFHRRLLIGLSLWRGNCGPRVDSCPVDVCSVEFVNYFQGRL